MNSYRLVLDYRDGLIHVCRANDRTAVCGAQAFYDIDEQDRDACLVCMVKTATFILRSIRLGLDEMVDHPLWETMKEVKR